MLNIPKDAVLEEISVEEFNREQLKKFKVQYKDLRQLSKRVTFALQYGGQENTLEKNCGFSHEDAAEIIANYKKLYAVSEAEKLAHVRLAEKEGFVTGAFGLKVRTPLLKQTVTNLKATPKEAEAERRTATNARFQSYGLLNTRAGVQFNREVRDSEYRLKIRPVASIHDAQYFLIKDDPEVILWVNKHLVKAVSWQEDPAISHPQVKLGGEFSIFWPDWAHELSLPNELDESALTKLVSEYVRSLTSGSKE